MMRVFDRLSGARSDIFAGMFWRLMGKGHADGIGKTGLEQLTDRVSRVSPPESTHPEIHCPECGIGAMRVVGDPPLSHIIYGHGAFQKLPPAPSSLKCNHCGHLQDKDRPSDPAASALSDAELDRVMGGVMSTRLRRAIRRR